MKRSGSGGIPEILHDIASPLGRYLFQELFGLAPDQP